MICAKIHGVPTVASSYQLSSRVVCPVVYTDIPWNKPFTSLRRSNNCKNLFIRSQGNVSPIPNPPHHVARCSTTKTTTTTIRSPKDMGFEQELGNGIGIMEFFVGKNYFVTGATGLPSKVFIEKALRMSPASGKIYVLIKAKDEATAFHRLKKEIIDCEIFRHQRQQYGNNYEGFMLSKLVPVVGDIGEPDLGIGSRDAMNRIIDEVEVFVNSAANTVLDKRYDVALNMNTSATLRVLELAKKCKKLRIFLHVSTGGSIVTS